MCLCGSFLRFLVIFTAAINLLPQWSWIIVNLVDFQCFGQHEVPQ
ncbi:hypothetical protein O53_731 [Microcystis aeruginosa TAIHU98]|uniref:Uncharacterized protein n=1 Tax=Microcystis aeruginosa TAIHU98 TaxID=1134457 RepID=L7EB94_MICAE|nr:hypothetical protein O53_731 [Microcystis aeruginosa TAIHU98]